jgi:hypothetical protein
MAAKLTQKMGTEWMLILEIEWADGGSIFYSDRDKADCETRLISTGQFDVSMMLEGSGDSQQVTVILDDTDGGISEIYDRLDVHKRPAKIWLLEKSLPLSDKMLVFNGELVTSIERNEESRSISFTILSKLNRLEVGFAMEEGDFPNIPDEALGKAWPLVFGQVCHLPAVKIRAPRRGYTQNGVCQALQIQCPSQSTGNQSFLTNGPNNTWEANVEKTIGPDLECVNRRFGEICQLRDLLEQQQAFEEDVTPIYNGVSFPQGQQVTLYVDSATLIGTFMAASRGEHLL